MAVNVRSQTLGEEIANSITHGFGLLAVFVGAPFLIVHAVRHGSAWNIVGVSVFIGSMIILYLASTLYHSIPHVAAKNVFRILDHSAIFLLIAGTYTPFTLGILRGGFGWTLFGLVWGLAILGIVLKAVRALWHPVLSNGLYLGMGWLIVIAARPFWMHMPHLGLLWILAGGIAYTGGIWFYATDKFKYGHMVWHLFVFAGTICHYFAVLLYASGNG
jgi:hemolysin III